MKVIAFNGSPNPNGSSAHGVSIMPAELKKADLKKVVQKYGLV